MVANGKDFFSIPNLDYALVTSGDPAQRLQFVEQLRHALINVGFLYLSNSSVDQKVVDSLIKYIPDFFALPLKEKQRIDMVNSKHFLGWTRLGAELTKGKTDYREQIDIATPCECPWKKEGDPNYWALWGPSQYPSEELIPGFRAVHERYLTQMTDLTHDMLVLFAEALGLPPTGLDKFYDNPERMQHRSKIVQYPVPREGVDGQGVGPHYDAGFITILLQASDHQPGLQVQNLKGDWIDVPPLPGTFVINIGKALEFVTQGIARATSHRVLSPSASSGKPRYSVPFFGNIGLDVRLASKESQLEFPSQILALRDARGSLNSTDSVNFSEFGQEPSGRVALIGRVKSHPDVAQRQWPDLFKHYFPGGLPEGQRIPAN